VVARCFPYVVYAFIAGSCGLLITDEIKDVVLRFGRLQMPPSLHSNLKKLVALELLSFVSLFGIGATLLAFAGH